MDPIVATEPRRSVLVDINEHGPPPHRGYFNWSRLGRNGGRLRLILVVSLEPISERSFVFLVCWLFHTCKTVKGGESLNFCRLCFCKNMFHCFGDLEIRASVLSHKWLALMHAFRSITPRTILDESLAPQDLRITQFYTIEAYTFPEHPIHSIPVSPRQLVLMTPGPSVSLAANNPPGATRRGSACIIYVTDYCRPTVCCRCI